MNARWVVGAACALALTAASADPKGDALIKKVRTALGKAKSMSATYEIKAGPQNIKGQFEGLKPNFGRTTMSSPVGGEMMRISTGKEAYMVMPSEKQYQTLEGGSGERILGVLPNDPLAAFFHPQEFGANSTTKYLGARKVAGKSYEVVQIRPKGVPYTQQVYVNAAGIPEGMEMVITQPEKQTIRFWLKNVKLNAPLTAEKFAYTPPADFTKPKGPEDSLLAVGQAAPDFALDQPGNQGLYSLEQARKGKKAVLVNFWFYS
jgi:outer membrane lipoprotein-sorting protein